MRQRTYIGDGETSKVTETRNCRRNLDLQRSRTRGAINGGSVQTLLRLYCANFDRRGIFADFRRTM